MHYSHTELQRFMYHNPKYCHSWFGLYKYILFLVYQVINKYSRLVSLLCLQLVRVSLATLSQQFSILPVYLSSVLILTQIYSTYILRTKTCQNCGPSSLVF